MARLVPQVFFGIQSTNPFWVFCNFDFRVSKTVVLLHPPVDSRCLRGGGGKGGFGDTTTLSDFAQWQYPIRAESESRAHLFNVVLNCLPEQALTGYAGRHGIPGLVVQFASVPMFLDTAPLLEKERRLRLPALVFD